MLRLCLASLAGKIRLSQVYIIVFTCIIDGRDAKGLLQRRLTTAFTLKIV